MNRPFSLSLSLLFAALLAAAATGFATAAAPATDSAPSLPPDVGKLLAVKACFTCHKYNDIGQGILAPNLRYVGDRRDKAWLKRWLANPLSIKNPTTMPGNQLNAVELDVMASWLAKQKNSADGQTIVKQVKNPVEAGKKLFDVYDCGTCHKIAGQGGNLMNTGPDLKGVSRRRPDLATWISDPQAAKKGTFMPTFDLSEQEVAALIAFLKTL